MHLLDTRAETFKVEPVEVETLELFGGRCDVTRRWGKAGIPLTADQIAARYARRGKELARVQNHEQEAYRLWRAGRLVPWNITISLDAAELFGPEVDIACGAEEPDVDHWEAGILYPTWEQVKALAKLCGVTPIMFVREPLPIGWTTLCYHPPFSRQAVPDPAPVVAFTQRAIETRLGGTT